MIARGVPAVLTSVAAGGVLYMLHRGDALRWPSRPRRVVLIWALASVALAVALFVWVRLSATQYVPGARRASGWVALLALAFNLVSFGVALVLLRSEYVRAAAARLKRLLHITILVLAVAPFFAFAWYSFAAPTVRLCGQAFSTNGGAGRRYVEGNLIGADDHWIYLGEAGDPTGAYLAVVPVSQVELQAIGDTRSCAALQPPSAAGTSAGG